MHAEFAVGIGVTIAWCAGAFVEGWTLTQGHPKRRLVWMEYVGLRVIWFPIVLFFAVAFSTLLFQFIGVGHSP